MLINNNSIQTVAIVLNTSWNIYNFRLALIQTLRKLGYKVVLVAPRDEYSQKLEEEGLIDHQRFAEQYIHSRSAKGYGPLRRKQELKQRGVNENIAQPLLDNIDWTSFAIEVLKKKVNHEFPKDTKAVLKLKKFLNYRGFNFSQIDQAFSSYKKT